MAEFSELIKNFDKIRDYMRDFFIYGFKTRNDYQYKSLRTYDNEKRRIESWLGDYFRGENTSNGKSVSVSLDSGRLWENPLYNCFRCKSFTENDIRLHFILLDILDDKKVLSVEEITDRICSDYGFVFDIQTVRIKLKEYCDEGIFTAEKRGKTLFYKKAEDNISPLFQQNQRLCDMVRLGMQDMPLGVVGSYILRRLGYENYIFLQKHNFIVHTLEDIILLKIISAVDCHREITIEYFGKQKVNKIVSGLPLQLKCSTQTGRRYLIIYSFERRRFFSARLDYIKSVTLEKTCGRFDEIMEKYLKNSPHSWGITFGNVRRNGNFQRLRFVIEVDKKEQFVAERLIREGRGGKVTQLDENHWEYENYLFDAGEASPWVKTFIGRIVKFQTDNEELQGRFFSDISKLNRLYIEGGEE